MRKIFYVFLLFSSYCFAQYPEESNQNKTLGLANFSINKSIIYWKQIFKGNPNNNHPNLKDGKGINCKIPKCKSCSYFMTEEFDFDYLIETKENRYRITAFNFRFKNSIQYNISGVTTDIKSNSLESFMLKNKDGSFRKNNTANTNLINLNDYLTSIFKPNTSTKTDNW